MVSAVWFGSSTLFQLLPVPSLRGDCCLISAFCSVAIYYRASRKGAVNSVLSCKSENVSIEDKKLIEGLAFKIGNMGEVCVSPEFHSTSVEQWKASMILAHAGSTAFSHIPGPSNRSPPATFRSAKASRGDLLEGAGTVYFVFDLAFGRSEDMVGRPVFWATQLVVF